MFRQGDLLFVPIDSVPSHAKKVPGLVVMQSQTTGHAHRISTGTVLEAGAMRLFVEVPHGAALTHDEHADIELPAGSYEVRVQREFIDGRVVGVVD